MTVNLIHTVIDANDAATETRASRDWAAITAIAPNHGMIFIDEDTVNQIGRLVDGLVLSNGETVTAYAYDDEDPYGALVCAFGPSLLPTQEQDYIRDRLANSTNGKEAARLFDLIIKLELQITLQGKDCCDAHIKGVNWPADEVEINRTGGNMMAMFTQLGLGDSNKESSSSEVPLDVFARAVEYNASLTDMPERLEKFVACAQRSGSTHVYWA